MSLAGLPSWPALHDAVVAMVVWRNPRRQTGVFVCPRDDVEWNVSDGVTCFICGGPGRPRV